MPSKKKTPTDIEIPAEVQTSAPVASRRIQKSPTASAASSRRRASAAKKAAVEVEQKASETITADAAPAEIISAPLAEQHVQASAEPILQAGLTEEEQIALLAYSFWEDRGRQGGSPEDDWYRAERLIRRNREQVEKQR